MRTRLVGGPRDGDVIQTLPEGAKIQLGTGSYYEPVVEGLAALEDLNLSESLDYRVVVARKTYGRVVSETSVYAAMAMKLRESYPGQLWLAPDLAMQMRNQQVEYRLRGIWKINNDGDK